jgi:hypothetical protein
MIVFGEHNLEVARMLHKMGKVAFQQRNYNLANSYISIAFLLDHVNKLGGDQEWVVDAYKDGTDVDAAIVTGDGERVLRVSLYHIFAYHSCIHGFRIALFHFHEANFLLWFCFLQIGPYSFLDIERQPFVKLHALNGHTSELHPLLRTKTP